MSRTQWSSVSGQLSQVLYRNEGEIYNEADNEAPASLLAYVQSDQDDVGYELVIEFISSGYDDPGQRDGGPDGVGVPPEGEDERLLAGMSLIFEKADEKPLVVELPKKVQEEIFDHYKDEIDEVEIEKGD